MLKPQKNKEHYFKSKYNKLERFISYFYQIDSITRLRNTKEYENTKFNILEIGIGGGLVSDHLRKMGLDVTTCDFDETLKPDVVADIRCLPFNDDSFDVVTAFEILEHIPFDDVEKILEKINKITKKYAIISLPYRSTSLEFALKFPGIRTILKKDFISFFIRIPLVFKGIESSGQHYWEIDAINHPLRGIKRLFKRHFRLIRVIRPVLDNYRIFFVLEKK